MRKIAIYIFFVLWLPVLSYGLQTIEVHFIDVGQGDAILIKRGDNKNILIDTGSPANGYKLKKYLKKNNIKKLDDVIITHMHFDHVGGLFCLIPDISILKIYDNGIEVPGDDFWEEYFKFVHDLKIKRKVLSQGDHLKLNRLSIKIISPSYPLFNNLNADSIALTMRYGKIYFLVAADINHEAEKRIIETASDLRSQILKVSHHGACDATSKEFLSIVRPEIAIISVGMNNRFGYPCGQALKRIRQSGAKIYRTDVDGSVIIRTDGEKYEIVAEGQ